VAQQLTTQQFVSAFRKSLVTQNEGIDPYESLNDDQLFSALSKSPDYKDSIAQYNLIETEQPLVQAQEQSVINYEDPELNNLNEQIKNTVDARIPPQQSSEFFPSEFTPRVETEEPLPTEPLEPVDEWGIRDEFVGLANAFRAGWKNFKLTNALLKEEMDWDMEERVKEIASLQAEAREIPRTKAFKEFNEAKTFGDALKRLALDPFEIVGQLVVESLAQFIPYQAAGIATGAGIGATVAGAPGAIAGATYAGITTAGMASLALEYSGKVLETMGEHGIDTTNPDQLLKGFQDEQLMSEARTKGLKKGVPIAIFDMVSAGIAGKFVTAPGRKILTAGTKELTTQAALGAGGEVAGTLVAGDEIQPSAVLAEAFAEIGSAAPVAAIRMAAKAKEKVTGEAPVTPVSEVEEDLASELEKLRSRSQTLEEEEVTEETKEAEEAEEVTEEEVTDLDKYEQDITRGETTEEESIATYKDLYSDELASGDITEEDVIKIAKSNYKRRKKELKEFNKDKVAYLQKDLDSWLEYEAEKKKDDPSFDASLNINLVKKVLEQAKKTEEVTETVGEPTPEFTPERIKTFLSKPRKGMQSGADLMLEVDVKMEPLRAVVKELGLKPLGKSKYDYAHAIEKHYEDIAKQDEKPTAAGVKAEKTEKLQSQYQNLTQTKERTEVALANEDLTPTQRSKLEQSLSNVETQLKAVTDEAKIEKIELEEIKPGRTEAIKEVIKVFEELDPEDQQTYEYVDEIRSLQDNVDDPNNPESATSARQAIEDSDLTGLKPEQIQVAGTNYQEIRDEVLHDIVVINRGADIGTVVEERAETWYKRQTEADTGFENKVKDERAKYEKSTGIKTEQSNMEWFSSLAIDYAVGTPPKGKIGTALKNILEKFKQYAESLLESAENFKKQVDEGNVSKDLQKLLKGAITEEIQPTIAEEPTDISHQLKKRRKKLGIPEPGEPVPSLPIGDIETDLENLFVDDQTPTTEQLKKIKGAPVKRKGYERTGDKFVKARSFQELIDIVKTVIAKHPDMGFWYYDFGKGLADLINPENMREVSVLFGVTSAQNAVEVNLQDTLHIMLLAREINPITNKEEFQKALRDRPKLNGNKLKINENQRNAIQQLYETGSYAGGIKVSNYMVSFERAVENEFMPFTVNDIHVQRTFGYLGTRKNKKGRNLPKALGETEHRYIQYLSSKLAEHFDMYPQMIQAMLWEYGKTELSPAKDKKNQTMIGDGSWESATDYSKTEIALIEEMKNRGEWTPSATLNEEFITAPLPRQKKTYTVKGEKRILDKKAVKDRDMWTNTAYIDDIMEREGKRAPRIIIGLNPGSERLYLKTGTELSIQTKQDYWSDIVSAITNDRGQITLLDELNIPHSLTKRFGSWGALEINLGIVLPGATINMGNMVGAMIGDATLQDSMVTEKPNPKGKDSGMLLRKADGTPFTEKDIDRVHKRINPKPYGANFTESVNHMSMKFLIFDEAHAEVVLNALDYYISNGNFVTHDYNTDSNLIEHGNKTNSYTKNIKKARNHPSFSARPNLLRTADRFLYKPIWEVFQDYQSKFGYEKENLKRPTPGRPGSISHSLKPLSPDERKLSAEKKAARKEVMEQDADLQAENVSEFIRNRLKYIRLASLELNQFLNELLEKTTSNERKLITFLLEKTDTFPEQIDDTELERMFYDQATRDRLEPMVQAVRKRFKELWALQTRFNPELSDKEVENYVTHIWDIDKNKTKDVVNWFKFPTENRFQKQRYVKTLTEGIDEFGLTPKYLDISDILKIYSSLTNHVIANKLFINDLKQLSIEAPDGKKYKLLVPPKGAPDSYKEIRHPAFRIGLTSYYKIHPDIVRALTVLFDNRITLPDIKGIAILESIKQRKIVRTNRNLLNGLESINAFLKTTQLTISFFHHLALSETAVPLIGFKATTKILWNTFWQGFVKGKGFLWGRESLAKDGVEHGVQLGASMDIPVDKISGFWKTRELRGTGIMKPVYRLLDSFFDRWSIALWDYLHDGFKITAYNDLVSKLDPAKVEDMAMAKREIAQIVNDTFGGQEWELLMVSPKMRQIMGWFLLSPDWTVSTVRQALAPTGMGAMTKEAKSIRKKIGRRFWIKAFIYYGIGINMLNALYRKRDEEENPEYYKDRDMTFWDYTMFGNTIGNGTRLFTGRNKDGTEEYKRWGKQFRELPELFYDDTGFNFPKAAIRRVGAKASPVIQITSQILTDKTPSGFVNYDLKDKQKMDWFLGAVKLLLKSPLPFSTQSMLRKDKDWSVSNLFVPGSKGMTRRRAKDLYEIALHRGDWNMVREIALGCHVNGINGIEIATQTYNSMVSDYYAEETRYIKTAEELIEKAKAAKTSAEQKVYYKKAANASREAELARISAKRIDGLINTLKAKKGLETIEVFE